MLIIGRRPFRYYCRSVLFFSLFVFLLRSPVYSIDFITEEDYLADKSNYKDYPLKILFRKLAEEGAPDKGRITNYIILKQVFDKTARAKGEAGGLRYEEAFGIIKDINEKNLRLWVPETNSFKDYYVGIEKVPIEKTGKYEINESNIKNCASIIYTLDQRIYKIKIDFRLSAPANLAVRRQDNNNIVIWKEVSTEKKPHEYKVFVNGTPYKTVTGTSAILPLTKGKVDSYYVKAVYRRGNISMESTASNTIEDDITAKELQKEMLAGETYDRVIAALNPDDYEKARRTLYDNEEFLKEFLDQERKENTEKLNSFFRDIDEGDALRTAEPLTIKGVESALDAYGLAGEKAKALPADIDVLSIAEIKIKEAADQKTLLETKNRELTAKETYDRAIAALNPDDYEKARRTLYDNEEFLKEFLDQERRENTEKLITVFKDIDEGDRVSTERPETARNMGRALRFYQRAEQNGNNLPPEIDIKFITELKIKASLDRKAILETKNKELQAIETFDRIIISLKPLEWEEGKRLLYENRPLLTEFSDQHRREIMEGLVRFFQDIDEGDRESTKGPETEKGLEAALIFYERAGEKAEALADKVDVRFISQQRLKEGLERKNLLEIKNIRIIAQERYNQIISGLKPGEWINGKMLLIDNRQLITEYLDDKHRENVERLVHFFQIIEEGDRLSVIQPETEESLENALTIYKKAEQAVKEFDESIDLTFIPKERIQACANRKALLVARKRDLGAAKKPKISLEELSKKPMVEIIGDEEVPDEDFDRDTTILLALKEFDEKNYKSSWEHFQKVFRKQIRNIRQGGKNRVKGVLGLPVECRAEVFFLIEIDVLMNREDESGISREDLEQIGNRVDNRSGLWVIIQDNTKLKKINRHLSTFNTDSFK